ncbi:MAG TPA: BatD family protein [Candidatus Hydrogenedens sp.]|nr:BatD family protein [Candidatus Hydrogenedens sp.]
MNLKFIKNKNSFIKNGKLSNHPLLFLFLLSSICLGDNSPIQIQVEPSEVGVGDTFEIIVNVQGSNTGEPVFNPSDGVQIIPQPFYSGTSTQMQFGPGQSRIITTKERHYRGSAIKEGVWTITASADVDGKQYVSPEARIKVSATSPSPSPQAAPQTPSTPQRQPQNPFGRRGPSTSSGQRATNAQLDKILIVESELSKKIVYQGEVLALTFRAKILDSPQFSLQTSSLPDLPNLDNFYMGKIQQNNRIENTSDGAYRLIELIVPVCPKSVGTLTVGSWDWSNTYVKYYNNWGWPDLYQISKSSKPLNLEVRALPPSPDNYYGAIGKYTLTSNLSQTEVNVGTPIYLSMTIRGSGYPEFVRAPAKPSFDWAYVSDPEIISGNLETWDNIEKTIRFSITPIKPGNYQVPSILYTYFNPQIGQYATLRTDTFPIKVTGDAKEIDNLITAGGTPRIETKSVELTSNDLLPLVTEGIYLKPVSPYRKGAIFAMFILPPFLSLLSIGFGLRKEYLQNNPMYRRKIFAYANAVEKFNGLKAGGNIANAVEQALKQYIGDVIGIHNTSGLTTDDVENLMKDKNIDRELVKKVGKILKTCERIRYSGEKISTVDEKGLEEGFYSLIEELRKIFK